MVELLQLVHQPPIAPAITITTTITVITAISTISSRTLVAGGAGGVWQSELSVDAGDESVGSDKLSEPRHQATALAHRRVT